jgi:hypothetical protein
LANVSSRIGKRIAEAACQTAIKAFQVAVEVAVKDAHAQVWTRGTYPLGEWRPFESPVDFTIWFAREPSARDLRSVRLNYERLKKIFPLTGSLNLYVATEVKLISGIVNPFELERDPQLKKKLEPSSEIHERAHAATYLFRTLDQELDLVMEDSERLQPRWDQQLLRVGQVLEDSVFTEWQTLPGRSLLRHTIDLAVRVLDIPKADRDGVADCLELYYQSVAHDVPIQTLRPLIEREPFLWAVFPHRFCFEMVEPPKMTGILAELALAEVSWELSDMLRKARLHPLHDSRPGFRAGVRGALKKSRGRGSESEQVRASVRSHLDSLEEFYDRFLCSKGVVSPGTDQRIEMAVERIRTLL